MLYTWAMALAGEQAAAVLGWLTGALALAGMLGYAASRFGVRAAWISVAALLCGSTLADSLAWSYVDWFAILFGLGCIAALDSWLQGLIRNGRTTEFLPVVGF
jgi:hypothetical protein